MADKSLPKKIINKGRRLLSKIVPYNIKYRPAGIVNISKNSTVDDIEFLDVNPPSSSKLDLTEAFIEDCTPYLKPIMTINYPGDFIIGIPGGRVYSYDAANMAVISNANNLVEQVSFQWSNDTVISAEHNILFRENIFLTPTQYKGNVFSMLAGGGAINYYYHWLFDAMPKLGLLKKLGLFDQIDYFLVPNYVDKYQKEYLDYFGIPASKVINAELEKHIEADKLYVASYVRVDDHHPKWTLDFLYNSLIKSPEKHRRDKRIYIPRGDAAANRKVINEPELIVMLKKYDFEIHHQSELSVVDQAKLFNSASVVVGAHGAGLSNLVFCEPGTKVLEFFPDQYVRHLFYDICNKRGLKYDYLLCSSEGTATNASDGQKISLTANVDMIEEKLKALLAS
jgi:hypothetical protein